MERENIYKLMRMLGVGQIKDRQDWVMASCPFAAYGYHTDDNDKRPSFGISVGQVSGFNCFACHRHGNIFKLPSMLTFLSHKDYPEIREFVTDNEGMDFDDYEVTKNKGTISTVPKSKLKNFIIASEAVLDENRLTKITGKRYKLLFDKKESRILFQIKDSNDRLVGIRGRYLGSKKDYPKYRTYTELSPKRDDPKAFGIWYGMELPLISGKALILVEGERDRLMLLQSGLVTNVWAAMGSKISGEQLFALQNVDASIVTFFDNDEAGWNARDKIIKAVKGLLPAYGITSYQRCNDPAEAVEKNKIGKVLKSISKI